MNVFDNNIVLVLVVACLEIHQILMKKKNIASGQPALKASTCFRGKRFEPAWILCKCFLREIGILGSLVILH